MRPLEIGMIRSSVRMPCYSNTAIYTNRIPHVSLELEAKIAKVPHCRQLLTVPKTVLCLLD